MIQSTRRFSVGEGVDHAPLLSATSTTRSLINACSTENGDQLGIGEVLSQPGVGEASGPPVIAKLEPANPVS